MRLTRSREKLRKDPVKKEISNPKIVVIGRNSKNLYFLKEEGIQKIQEMRKSEIDLTRREVKMDCPLSQGSFKIRKSVGS